MRTRRMQPHAHAWRIDRGPAVAHARLQRQSQRLGVELHLTVEVRDHYRKVADRIHAILPCVLTRSVAARQEAAQANASEWHGERCERMPAAGMTGRASVRGLRTNS